LRSCQAALRRIGLNVAWFRYGDRVIWWVAITAIGTVLAGLALPLAFIQLGALRQDRLRAT
jgi:hypothetical protein